MIQVCSRCGTRWNVRDKQRTWCPRCNGTLLAPLTGPPWGPAPPPDPPEQKTPPQPSALRWIAVRPGAAPPPPRRRRSLGPTPRYAAIPRWGLIDRIGPASTAQQLPTRPGPSESVMRLMLGLTLAVLGLAALAHAMRYVLLLVNRDTLLRPLVAGIGRWPGVAASVAAVVATAACATVLTRWLRSRRAVAFVHRGRDDPRSARALWLGCLAPPATALLVARAEATAFSMADTPVVAEVLVAALASCLLPLAGSVWLLVYLTELAKTEGHYPRMRIQIWVWWLLAMLSVAVSAYATLTSTASDAQGIANNTVATTMAYLLGVVAVAGAVPVIDGFTRRPVERPAHRWLVVDEEQAGAESGGSAEDRGAEPRPETSPEESLESKRTEAAA